MDCPWFVTPPGNYALEEVWRLTLRTEYTKCHWDLAQPESTQRLPVYNAGIVDRSKPLPKKLGGATVGLLLGITSTRIDPVLVHTLPNGLGIYRTPFIDQDGS